MKKRFTSLVALGLIAFVGSCGGPQWARPNLDVPDIEQGKIYVCLDLPKEQLPAAHEAVTQWDRALHQWKHVIAIDNQNPVDADCKMWVHETSDAPEDDASNHHPMAWTSTLGGFEITLRKGWYEQDTTGILMHEMGHAFGAQHVPGTLMNPTWVPHMFVCPDVTTVAQVAAWNQINLEGLSYCMP